MSKLQTINNELSAVFKNFGTQQLTDLLTVCSGNKSLDNSKFNLLCKHFHPLGYKIVGKTKKTDDMSHLECEDVVAKPFHMKVYGVRICVHTEQHLLIITGVLDDVIVGAMNHEYITTARKRMCDNMPGDFETDAFNRFLDSLSLKDWLLETDIYAKFVGCLLQSQSIRQKPMSQIVKEFVNGDLYSKRCMLNSLLAVNHSTDSQYIAYMLYDLISNDSGGQVDTAEQVQIYDSFTWTVKTDFKQAMKSTIQYTNKLTKIDAGKIPLEQQICLMNVSDSVKEKAMVKLKEVKSKSDESGAKARHYLDGLLKIPFGVCKKEPVMEIMGKLKKQYNKSGIELVNHMNGEIDAAFQRIKTDLLKGQKPQLVGALQTIGVTDVKSLTKEQLKSAFEANFKRENVHLFDASLANIQTELKSVCDYMNSVRTTLDASVHGHDTAKKQLERIIGQWVSGKQSGYCLGFEGNPGIGKTTVAKGIANCLKDENGVARPFALIAVGGDSNASTLVGHSYTYVGSIWGQIAQILMDTQCMNPVILFDEVDKISKTEHGKEITGILTHLLDPTQNDTFQDKYFAGIDFDLSKVLFILSYNDPSSIDGILLDRVHRIKFDSLTMDDKLVVAQKHLLPEIYEKFDVAGAIEIDNDVVKFVAENYTLEPGARKLKEKLFEIVGEINVNALKHKTSDLTLPVRVTVDDVKNKYFKDKREVTPHKIHTESKVGVINALWANEMSQGGVLPLQVSYCPASRFLELTLTGSLGEVMKESISVSLTNAWNLTSEKRQKELIKQYNNPKLNEVFGVHVHCPSISTRKDGPSATTAFTVLFYSLFNNRKIKNEFGITGETNFGYDLTEIGGLQYKIIHSIPCGIKEFIFPVENKRDFEKIMEKYKNNSVIDGIKFHCIQTVQEVLELILEPM